MRCVSAAWSIGRIQIYIRGGVWKLLENLSGCDVCVHDFNNTVKGDHVAKRVTYLALVLQLVSTHLA